MNEYRFSDLQLGHRETFSVTVTEQMLRIFKEITGDINPLHNDDEFAMICGYPGRVAYGMLTASFLSTLAGVYLPGRYSLIQETECKFIRPVFAGDKLTISGEVTELNESVKRFVMKTEIRNYHGEKVLRGTMKVGFLNEQR